MGKNLESNRNKLIDNTKGLAIFLVVFGHIIQYSEMARGINFFDNWLFKIIYSFHMPLFMFISGYLMEFSIKKNDLKKVIISRTKNLLIPYLSWSFIDLTIYLIKEVLSNNYGLIANILMKRLKSIILFPSIWFLFTLFVLNLILLITIKLKKKIGNISYLLSIVIIFIFPSFDYLNIYYIKWFYLFFILGYFVNKYNRRFIEIYKKIERYKIILFLILLFGILIMMWNNNDYIYNNKMNFMSYNYYEDILRYFYRYIIAFIGIGLTFYLVNLINNIKLLKALNLLSKYSIDIYLLQRYIVEIIFYKVIKSIYLKDDNLYLPYIMEMISIFSCILLCVIISKYIIRKNKGLKRILLGNRN